ncbi:MAG: hypothetical protein QM793_11995 [Muricomes sp.]
MKPESFTNRKFSADKKRFLFLAVVFLSIIRIILCNKIQIRFRCNEYYDDLLLFNYAQSLLSGGWLGAYSNITLVKGISYPAFIVLCHLLSLPYTTGLALLNIGSALTLVRAISPRLKNIYAKYCLYILLIFSPTGFSAYITQRTYRMAVIPYAVLLTLSCFAGIYFRRNSSLRKWIPWTLGAGISLSFFWYIREDSIWILPTLSVILLLTLLYYVKQHCTIQELLKRTVVLLIPFFILGMTTLFISGMNYKHYGIFAVNDRTGTEFGALMSNLYKIEDKNAPADCWVSKAQLQDAIDVSPSLASVKDSLYTSFNAWGWNTGKEIPGDLVAWAIRSGVQDAGYYKDAVTTNDFYRQINHELEEAFQNQTLTEDSSIHFTSQSKGISMSEVPGLMVKSLRIFYGIGKYNATGLKSEPFALGSLTDIRECEVLFGNLAYYSLPDETSDVIDTQLVTAEDPIKSVLYSPIRVGNAITACYTKLAVPVNIVAGLSYILLCIYLFLNVRRKKDQKKMLEYVDLWLAITGFGLSALVLVGGVVFFTSWFPPEQEAFIYFYSAGSYPLIQAAKYLALYCALRIVWTRFQNSRKDRGRRDI